jgi:glycosylphosphatidylinositol transamidase (GPIT) subunit GPI8
MYSCNSDLQIKNKDSDFNNHNILDLFRGRTTNIISPFRKLNTNQKSKIIIYLSTHTAPGGLIKFRANWRPLLTSQQLNQALWEMYYKNRYKEILFIIDTCHGQLIFDGIDIPNLFTVSSSIGGELSYGHTVDTYLMGSTVERFTFFFYEKLEEFKQNDLFELGLDEVFTEIQHRHGSYLKTNITMVNKLNRIPKFQEFFGNYLYPNERNTKFTLSFNSSKIIFPKQKQMDFSIYKHLENTEKEIFNLREYNEEYKNIFLTHIFNLEKVLYLLNTIFFLFMMLRQILFN